MKIELLYREIQSKKSFSAIPPDYIVYIECGNVIFRPRECVRSQVPNKMINQSEPPTKSVGKQLYGVCALYEREGEHPIGTGARKVIDLNL